MKRAVTTMLTVLLMAVSAAIAKDNPPKLQVVNTTTDSITVELQAGDNGTPGGFQLFWQSSGRVCMADFIPSMCSQYALLPGQKIVITVGRGQCAGCHIDTCYGIACATPYMLWVQVEDQSSNTAVALTSACNPVNL